MVLFAAPPKTYLAAGICLLVYLVLCPAAFRRLFRMRWLVVIGILVSSQVVWGSRLGEGKSAWDGLLAGMQMAARASVILISADSLTSRVNISEVAGLFERVGLRGLGFSLGVAMNLLPALSQSATNAWHSLWMRGGLRRQRWRGLQFLIVTIIANALRRAEEIALAAETRAFSPEKALALPLKTGTLDWLVALVGVLVGLSLLLI